MQQSLDKEKTKVAKLQTDIQHLDETKKVTHWLVSITSLSLPFYKMLDFHLGNSGLRLASKGFRKGIWSKPLRGVR